MDQAHHPSFCNACDICFYYNTFEIKDLPSSNPWSREHRRSSSYSSQNDYNSERSSFSLPGVSAGEFGDLHLAINDVAQRYGQPAPQNQWNSFAFYDAIRRGGSGAPVVKRKPVPPPRDIQMLNHRVSSSPIQSQRPMSYFDNQYSGPAELESPIIGSYSPGQSDSPDSLSEEENFVPPVFKRKLSAAYSNQLGDDLPKAVVNSPKLQRTLGLAGNRNSVAVTGIAPLPTVARLPAGVITANSDKSKARRLQKKWRASMSG